MGLNPFHPPRRHKKTDVRRRKGADETESRSDSVFIGPWTEKIQLRQETLKFSSTPVMRFDLFIRHRCSRNTSRPRHLESAFPYILESFLLS